MTEVGLRYSSPSASFQQVGSSPASDQGTSGGARESSSVGNGRSYPPPSSRLAHVESDGGAERSNVQVHELSSSTRPLASSRGIRSDALVGW